MESENVYEDATRAESYAKLGFPGTYYLAYRDLPRIISRHVNGKRAIDFGCGTGRSTRFLKKLGFSVIGVDIAEDMIKEAKKLDAQGDYRLMRDESLDLFANGVFDLALSVFTFDNIPTQEKKVKILEDIRRVLKDDGCVVNLVSSPEIYTHEWASFSTRDFPENKKARSGDRVRIIQTDVEDRRPVEDIVFSSEDYRAVFRNAGWKTIKTYRPLGRVDEPYPWVNETKIPPWTIHVLKKRKNI